jgi:MYXO-CTERM domain-containing protein
MEPAVMSNVLIAAAAVLGTCTLPQGDITSPYTWGNYFLDKYAAERAEAMTLEAGPTPLATPRTVLLITGVTIPAVWFDPIKARLERDGFRTVVYEPPALLSGDLFDNSRQLGTVIDGIRAQTGEDKIDILAECTGGLIARHYIQSLGGDRHVRRLVTFISPQHGLPKASLAQQFVSWQAVRDLTPGSAFLRAVNDKALPPTVPVTSIYTCTDEYIQPYSTSEIPGAKNINLCTGTFIGHFQFFYDREIYKLMHGELVAPVVGETPGGGKADEDDDDGAGQPGDPDAADATDPAAAGCSTSTSTSGSSGLALVGALAFAVRRRRRRAAA